jgi:8-oxo-dGTP pyrophosphatase MutT (NUDIX family)
VLEKVTAFVTNLSSAKPTMLLIEHPYAGIQIPAGTVEGSETPDAAVLREVAEETGLTAVTIRAYLGCRVSELPPNRRVVMVPTRLYARPDQRSWDWAHLPRGAAVTILREAESFVQVDFEEFDRWPNAVYTTYRITGWVPPGTLTQHQRRHFYHLECAEPIGDQWTVEADGHCFEPFWASLDRLPAICHPQDEWLQMLPHHLLSSLSA